MPLDPETNEVAITCYLLQPKGSASEPEPLKMGDLVIIYAQNLWKTAKTTSRCTDGDGEGMWGLNYISATSFWIDKKGEADITFRDGNLDQSQENLGILRGEYPQPNLNNPRMKIEIQTGMKECWKLSSAYMTYCGRRIMVHKCEQRYIK